jgi:hypothetical protein
LKRLSTGVLAAIFAVGYGLTSVSAATLTAASGNTGNLASPSTLAQASALPPADFGTPPSGEVPILFNDHHVYSKPDRLKENRVLAALVRGNEILVPLRSMFEQMGATVSYDPASKTADVSKPGSDVKVTVGKPEVVINGESRPLDVPPEIYKGAVVVPVRVISEGMGAYVQWVPDKRLVVVRYVAAPPPPPPPTPTPTAPPTPPPTPKPVPPPTPTPTPTPVKVNYEHFVVGDYLFSPKVYNEFSNGIHGNQPSFAVRGAFEFPAFGLPWMIAGDYRSWQYQHNSTYPNNGQCDPPPVNTLVPPPDQSCVTIVGGGGSTYVPGFTAKDTDYDVVFGLTVVDPRIYIGVGYLWRQNNYGYPIENGFGFGLEKLPDLDQPFSVYGSVYYYPSVQGGTPASYLPGGTISYRDLKYQGGITYTLGKFEGFGVFLDANYLGDSLKVKNLGPVNATHNAASVGLGFKF